MHTTFCAKPVGWPGTLLSTFLFIVVWTIVAPHQPPVWLSVVAMLFWVAIFGVIMWFQVWSIESQRASLIVKDNSDSDHTLEVKRS